VSCAQSHAISIRVRNSSTLKVTPVRQRVKISKPCSASNLLCTQATLTYTRTRTYTRTHTHGHTKTNTNTLTHEAFLSAQMTRLSVCVCVCVYVFVCVSVRTVDVTLAGGDLLSRAASICRDASRFSALCCAVTSGTHMNTPPIESHSRALQIDCVT
jgi:hypothetical protein